MLKEYEQILEVSLPKSHELAQLESGSSRSGGDVFRTRAAILLKQPFGADVFILRETGSNGGSNGSILTYRVAVRTARVEEFRRKVAELGLQVQEPTHSESKH